jgi:competence protein ComEA
VARALRPGIVQTVRIAQDLGVESNDIARLLKVKEGDRVEDAVKAAGGPTADADIARLNLAQRLRDEGQVIVPRLDETPAASKSGSAQSSGESRKININSASAAELDALPGIGATYSQRIMDYRTKNGPFKKIEDLKDKKIIPAATFEKIKDLIDVR